MITPRRPALTCALAPAGHPALRAGTGSGQGRASGIRAGTTPPTTSLLTDMNDNCLCRFIVVVNACL